MKSCILGLVLHAFFIRTFLRGHEVIIYFFSKSKKGLGWRGEGDGDMPKFVQR